jgi:hypothetical protein
VNDFEQTIYNKHLASYKKHQNKPFKFRKNFTNLDESTKTILLKLANFFKQHNKINIDIFFAAPYYIYTDAVKFDLQFYTSLKAVKLYREYIKKLNRQDINSDDIKNHFLESTKFILKFCKEHKIKFLSYPSYKEGYINAFFEHLKHGNVSIYVMFMFPDFETQFKSVDKEMREHLISDTYDDIDRNRVKFYNAHKKTKEYFDKIFNLCKTH